MTQKVYIAGPMSGYEDSNRAAFENAEQCFLDWDWAKENIFNPIDHEASLMVQKGLVKDTQEAYRMCLKIDLEWLCEHATHIYMLKGWEKSLGARAEHATAVALGLEIEYEV